MLTSAEAAHASPRVVEAPDLSALLEALITAGYRVLGPTVRDGVIALGEIASLEDLPAGVGQEQSNGRYRLRERTDGAVLGHAVGPHAWKRFLSPPSLRLFTLARSGRGFSVEAEPDGARPLAFFGVRPCDLAAIARLDRVLLGGPSPDPVYRARRESSFLIAASCTEPEGTCFCASLGTGPEARSGFDLALTELLEGRRHEFIVRAGSPKGEEVLRDVPSRPAGTSHLAAERAALSRAAASMGRTLDAASARDLLAEGAGSPHWDDVGRRCLSCANCTMVCPTCFCTTVEDASDLSGLSSSRLRRWDSCHTLAFSYLHGGSIRRAAAARYRQWMTHKLSTWADQFGETGCVGCGRCITWCPAGIDLTEEARALAEAPPSPAP